jgi:uncharacterized SAM-binding protein YcdF (DUF218 family)
LFAVFVVAVFVWIGIAPLVAGFLIVDKPLAEADAIFVLGGALAYVERTQKAAELYRQGVAPKVIVTDDGEEAGWSRREQKNPKYYELAVASLVASGVPRERIEIADRLVDGTIDEARLLSDLAAASDLKRVMLVTSAYHTRRTWWTFNRVMTLDQRQVEFGIASPPPGVQTPDVATWWFRRRGWNWVGGEYVKLGIYSLYY